MTVLAKLRGGVLRTGFELPSGFSLSWYAELGARQSRTKEAIEGVMYGTCVRETLIPCAAAVLL